MSGQPALTASTVEFTDEQRTQLAALFREDPYRPHIQAARSIGIAGSKGQIRAALASDPIVAEALASARHDYLKKKKLGVDALLGKLADVAHDDGNSSQLRAVQAGLALNGVSTQETQRVEHTGEDGGPIELDNPDVAAAIERFTSNVVRLAERGRAELPPADAGD